MSRLFQKMILLLCLILTWGFVHAQDINSKDGILLKLKSKPGKVCNSRMMMIGNGMLSLSLKNSENTEKPFSIETSLPVDFSLEMYFTETTQNVDENGNISLDVVLTTMNMNLGIMSQSFNMQWNGQEMQVLMNNQPMVQHGMDTVLQDKLKGLNKPIQMVISPRGKLLSIKNPYLDDESLKDNPFAKMMRPFIENQSSPLYPENPIQPGDSWSVTTRFNLPEGFENYLHFSKPLEFITEYQAEKVTYEKGGKLLTLTQKSNNNFSNATIHFGKIPMPSDAKDSAFSNLFENISILLNEAVFKQDGEMKINVSNGNIVNAQSENIINIAVAVNLKKQDNNMPEIKLKGSLKLFTKIENI